MQKLNNIEIRGEIERRRLHYYEVADALGINAVTFSYWLRTELTEERKQKVLKAIESLA